MKKMIAIFLCVLLLASGMTGCAPAAPKNQPDPPYVSITDDLGRTLEIPAQIMKVSPAGSVATMMLGALAPDEMVTVSTAVSENQTAYLPTQLAALPETGQMYGGKANLNLETLLTAAPQLIIDLGEKKNGIAEDLDTLQEQVGIPVIFLEADLANMAHAFRVLGTILSGKEERAEKLASFVDETLRMAQENAAKIPDAERKTVLYTSGPAGLDTNATGSAQAQVIELVGANNAAAIESVSGKAGGTPINFEQLYLFDPDVILFAPGSIYETAEQDPAWHQLRAIREGQFYEIPGVPYNWMSNPPSMNMLLGVRWLGNLLYPEVYSYDMAQTAKEFYSLFWNAELTDAEANGWLGK